MGNENFQEQVRFRGGISQIVQQQHSTVGLPITVHERANIVILGDQNPGFRDRLAQQSFVPWIAGALGRVNNIVTGETQCTDRLRNNVGIGKEAHLFGGDCKAFFGRRFAQARRIEKAGIDVFGFQDGIGFQHGSSAGAIRKHFQHHGRRDAASPDQGLPSHLAGLSCNSSEEIGSAHDERA